MILSDLSGRLIRKKLWKKMCIRDRAHPIQIRDFGEPGSEDFYQKTENLIEKLKKEGLGGLECFHPDQSPEESERFARIAKKQGLRITRGSDFHGSEYK